MGSKTTLIIFLIMKIEMVYPMALLYVAAGIFHFIKPKIYRAIMPPWLPWHHQLILLSGIAEVALGILLIPMATRIIAAWLIIILLIAIFPANIQMVINWSKNKNPKLWMAILRLPLQLVLIWWAWQYTS